MVVFKLRTAVTMSPSDEGKQGREDGRGGSGVREEKEVEGIWTGQRRGKGVKEVRREEGDGGSVEGEGSRRSEEGLEGVQRGSSNLRLSATRSARHRLAEEIKTDASVISTLTVNRPSRVSRPPLASSSPYPAAAAAACNDVITLATLPATDVVKRQLRTA